MGLFDSLTGGGGQQGGSVVQYTDPGALMAMGQYGSQAAQAAGQIAQQQSNNALAALQQQYASQLSNIKPYTSEGITAVNALNQLLGLPGYNPGTAPSAPITPQDYAKQQITDSAIDNYILSNTLYSNDSGNNYLKGVNHYLYEGQGAYDQGFQNSLEYSRYTDPQKTLVSGKNIYDSLSAAQKDEKLRESVSQYLQNNMSQGYQGQYAANTDVYNQQMDLYNQAVQQQSTFKQLTPEEINAQLSQTPGYQFQLGQGVDALQRAASSKGILNSGRLMQGLVDYGQGLASQTYGTRVQQLSNLLGAGQQAAQGANQLSQNVGQGSAAIYGNLGDNLANSMLSGSNSMMQGVLQGNQNYSTIGGSSQSGNALGGIGSLIGSAATIGQSGGLSGLFKGLF